ncbi:hypothetical protein RM553_19255 [Zunongwangia sp. F363]|uniref:Uncharacterized protein n=1 Tax=Autumnicola tepida TaxID=3075595 RepID=A0ABU3CF49_9FLAO|nr:hypothetical protein [Zunongwangia sp. F363]MDT0644979.1 hypothetical protein [Zunongwangia sp. F363]
MLSRINIFSIIKDHFKTLRSLNQSYKFINFKDFLLFLLFPLIIASIVTYKGYSFKDQLGNLIAAVAIFGGFLFNLLAIIYGQIDKIQNDAEKEDDNLKKRFVKEIHINISFCIVLSILIVISLLLTTVDIPNFRGEIILERMITGTVYFLLILFVLTLIMVLNRVYILLKKDSE